MSDVIPNPRRNVEVWFRITPRLPIWEVLSDLEPENYRIVETDFPARETGSSIEELTWLIRQVTKRYTLSDGMVFRPGNGDLIVVPDSKIVLRLLIYSEFPDRMFGRNVMPFGDNFYVILLGPYLTNGPYHPCYRQIDRRVVASVSWNCRSNEFRYIG